MFTLAEGAEWLRRANLAPSMDAALAALADLQARRGCAAACQRTHVMLLLLGCGAQVVDPNLGRRLVLKTLQGPCCDHEHHVRHEHDRRLQRAHLLFVADGTGADLSAVDAGLGIDPRTGLPAAPAATAATVLQLVGISEKS